MKTKKVVLIDVDDVVCQPKILHYANLFMGTNYCYDDLKEYYIDNQIIPKEKHQEFVELLTNKDLYENLELFDSAKEVIEKLAKVYDVYFCSSCTMQLETKNSGTMFEKKYNFLRRNFPFVAPSKIIFCACKNLLNADYMIDDKPSNLTGKGIKTKILFSAYHNKNMTENELEKLHLIRVNNWSEIEKMLLK